MLIIYTIITMAVVTSMASAMLSTAIINASGLAGRLRPHGYGSSEATISTGMLLKSA